jgi:hypothetical protein
VAANDIWKLGCTFRRDRKHEHRRDRECAEGDRAAVDHDGDQDHRRHEKRALGRDLGARQQQIEQRRGKRRRGRPFLDRKACCEQRDQRQQRPHHEEHHAGDDRHVIARDRSSRKMPKQTQWLKYSLLPAI